METLKDIKLTEPIQEMRKKIAEVGALMYQRRLTDSAGGNISVRINDILLMTPRMAGSQFHWQLKPQQIIITDLDGNKIEGEGEPSREGKVHIKLLNTFYPTAQAVVHGHALNALVFCAHHQPMPTMLASLDKFGAIDIIRDIPAHSTDLAEELNLAFRGKEELVKKQAAIMLAARHGVFVLAKDLEAGYDALERVDVNAYCALMGNKMNWLKN